MMCTRLFSFFWVVIMGVKELWLLLQPASRRVTVESLYGKRLAIDILYKCFVGGIRWIRIDT
jgi:hypothetical protein